MIVATVGKYLSSLAAVQALLSAPNFGVCLWPDVVDQGAPLPNGRLQQITGKRDSALDGQPIIDVEATFAIDIWAESQARADQIGETIWDALCNPSYFGPMLAGTSDELKIHFIEATSELDSDELPLDGSAEFGYRCHKVYKTAFDRPALT